MVGFGHLRAADEHWYDEELCLYCGSDFLTNKVIGIIEASMPVVVGERVPLFADYYNQRAARSKVFGETSDKVAAGFDVGDIHEHVLSTARK